ncbi:MAG: lipoyl(octanoyl) transferase LipB [Planctomycetes bacterium]|nr:lipoyl(octanoyl) transferase LipB [Planctomycetota bacterium]
MKADRTVFFQERRQLAYDEGVSRQRSHLALMAADPSAPGTIIMAEHQPVITCGRSGDGSNLLVSPDQLAKAGIDYRQSGRGGDVTYHGPGQWTVYPILRLAWFDRDLHRYLRLLEECVIRFLLRYGIQGVRRPGLTGVWVDGGKVAAVGVAVSRWITWHGVAVNIDPDLGCFHQFMHPCGITADRGSVASLASLTGRRHTMAATRPVLQQALLEVLDLQEVVSE